MKRLPRSRNNTFAAQRRYRDWLLENGTPEQVASMRRSSERPEVVRSGVYQDLGGGCRRRRAMGLREEAR